MTTAGSSLEQRVGPDGIVQLWIRHCEIRLRVLDVDVVRLREGGGHDVDARVSS